RPAPRDRALGPRAEQLPAKLRPKSIRLQTRVEGIVAADGRAVGVTLTGGEEMQGEAVVIATDAATAERLVQCDLPSDPVAVTCLYFATQESLYSGARLLLNANPGAFVNHAAQLTNLAPASRPGCWPPGPGRPPTNPPAAVRFYPPFSLQNIPQRRPPSPPPAPAPPSSARSPACFPPPPLTSPPPPVSS